jgi:hypothetical protein
VGRQGRQPGGTRAGEDGGRGGSIGDEAPVMAAGGCGGQAAAGAWASAGEGRAGRRQLGRRTPHVVPVKVGRRGPQARGAR